MKPRVRLRLRGTREGSTFPFPPKDGQGKVKEAGDGMRRGGEAVKEPRIRKGEADSKSHRRRTDEGGKRRG